LGHPVPNSRESRILPCMQNFRVLHRRGWSWQKASLTPKSFCPFWPLRHNRRSHLWTHPTLNTSLCVVLTKVISFRGKRDEILNLILYPQHENMGLSWRSMENCSRSNSGKVSHIHFQLGTWVDHISGII